MSGFIARNKPDWDELELLLKRARRSLHRLSPEELSRLDVLYRRATTHLAQVQTRTSDARLAQYLNGLTTSAHSLIYLPPRGRALAGGLEFLLEGFARNLVRQGRWHLASLALLAGGALLAYFAGMEDVEALYALLPPGDPRVPGAPREVLLEVLRSGRDQGAGTKFAFASFLFSHNLKVGMLSMALGILAAVPTCLLIAYNGMILGAFVAVHVQAGLSTEMWAWILPHGITEIGAIVLCGGIGLQLGMAIVCPRQKSQEEALRETAPEVGRTLVGVTLMLIFAAVVESYLRQSNLPDDQRLMFAAGTAVFWVAYLTYGAIRERQARWRALSVAAGDALSVAAGDAVADGP